MPYNLSTMQSIFCNNKEITEIRCNGSLVYQKSSGPDYTEPFYVENISDADETLSIVKSTNFAPALTIEYKTYNTDWKPLGTTSTTALTLTVVPGEKVYLRCNTTSWYQYSQHNNILGVSKVGGNIMSLLYGSNFIDKTRFPSGSTNNFYYLFRNNTTLVDASKLLLPATTLTNYCYFGMFNGCASLTSAPALPATTLTNYCYSDMFNGCASLTSAPALPATTLADHCYNNMLRSCRSLTMPPALPATTLADHCYRYMFNGDTSLISAPELPATTLVNYCYANMFSYCSLLNNVKCLATSGINENNSTTEWLSGVSSTGTFTKAAGVTWPTGTSGIPSGWTVLEV